MTVGSFCSCNHKDRLYPVAADLDIIEVLDIRYCQETLNGLNVFSKMLP